MTVKLLMLIAIAAAASAVIAFVKNQTRFRSSLQWKYLLQLFQLLVILLCVAEIVHTLRPTVDIRSILLGGSALIVAILGFAAQPVISDIMCGLLISIHKPFEIGDRIVMDGMTPGTVADITLRHTVIAIYDDLRILIPNSQLNSRIVTNTSYRMKDRCGIHLKFSVSYDTDVQKAMDVIRDCVAASPYTLSIEKDGIREDSGPVYFLNYGDSALILETTIWVARETEGCKAVTDVNTRVLNGFRKYGIEIPYPYVNVMEFQGSRPVPAEITEERPTAPAKRSRRTNTVHMEPGENRLEESIQMARSFAQRQNLDKRAAMQLELLTEESLGFVKGVVDHTSRDFWIEGTGAVYRLHISFNARIGSEEYKKLIKISSSGRNDADNGFSGKIWNAVLMGLKRPNGKGKGSKGSYEWRLSDTAVSEEEIGQSILGAMASDIRVSVTTERVELTISKAIG